MPLRPPAAIPIHPNPCRARRRIASIGSLCALLVLTGCADFAPFRAVRISTAATSQTLCTAAFVSKMDPERAYRDEVRPAPGMSLVAWGLRYRIDPDRQSVSTDILGRAERRSIYREGLGCVVALGEVRPERWQAPPADPAAPDPFPSLASATPVQAPDPRIREAIDLAFEEPASGAPRRTQAVVVVHRGRLIGERYADDVRLDTPLQGHSISKSLTHALIGILARQGRVDPDRPVAVAAWQGTTDGRATITPNQLLGMTSGLPWDEYAGGWDESTRMWFDETDPYAYSTSVAAVAAPGQQWGYSNLGYTVLSRLIRDVAGGSARDVLDLAHRELFAPLGIRSAVLTFDGTDTPQGSNLFLASARDWARFGLLYLADGRVGERRILPAGWVAAAIRPSLDAGYGRGFWLNNTDRPHPLPGRWGMPGAPADAYFARGYLGQFIVIVPSLDLVVVRLGISYRAGGDIATVGRMVGQIAQALGGPTR